MSKSQILTEAPTTIKIVSRLRHDGTHLYRDDARIIKNANIYIQPRETRQRTLARLSGLIRLLLPMLGKPKTPAVMLCAALGLYAFEEAE
jgi:hypothetical protein